MDDLRKYYYAAGTAQGWNMPRIAPYHCGPYRLAIMLQDPGSPYTAGSGAQVSREIGVRNNDPTAEFIGNALAAVGMPENEVLLLNALPGFGMKPNKGCLTAGAAFNSQIIRRAGVKSLLVCGRLAQRANLLLDLPAVNTVATHHPSRRGHNHASPGGRGKWMKALKTSLENLEMRRG